MNKINQVLISSSAISVMFLILVGTTYLNVHSNIIL